MNVVALPAALTDQLRSHDITPFAAALVRALRDVLAMSRDALQEARVVADVVVAGAAVRQVQRAVHLCAAGFRAVRAVQDCALGVPEFAALARALVRARRDVIFVGRRRASSPSASRTERNTSI